MKFVGDWDMVSAGCLVRGTGERSTQLWEKGFWVSCDSTQVCLKTFIIEQMNSILG
jgi:hypothetical protein